MKGNRIEKIIVVLLLISGVVMSLIQFLYNRSLWVDEANLAVSIVNRDFFELLKPLEYDQVAPILFLQIEKIFSLLWPDTEYGLRLFPLLCFWGSIYFFYKIIKKQFNNSYTIIFALFFFVFNRTFIYYSSEVKQYMTDMFVLLSIFYFIRKDYNNEKNKLYILGISGIIAVFLSNVAPVILFTCGAYLIYEDFFITKKKKIAPLLTLFAVWLSVFSIYYYFFIYEHPTKNFMIQYWRFTFLPHESFQSFFSFLIDQKRVIQNGLFPRLTFFVYIMHLLLLTGVIEIVLQKKFHLLILFCTPILLHLFLSALWLYPFAYRLILYTMPCIIMLCALGFNYIVIAGFAELKITKYCFISLIIPISFLYNFGKFPTHNPIPLQNGNIKEGIKFIQRNIRENENIYIYYFAIPGYEYYDSIGFANIKARIFKGIYNRHGIYSSGDVDELNDLHGKTWLLFSHTFADEEVMINYIDSLGHTKIKEFKSLDSSAYLYDFGE